MAPISGEYLPQVQVTPSRSMAWIPCDMALALRFKAMAYLLTLILPGSQSTQTVGDQYRAGRGWTWWPSLKTMEGLECCQWSAGSNLYALSPKTTFLPATKTILCPWQDFSPMWLQRTGRSPAVCSTENGPDFRSQQPPGPVLFLENLRQRQRAAGTKDIQRHHQRALNICALHLKGTVTKVAKDSHMHAGALH